MGDAEDKTTPREPLEEKGEDVSVCSCVYHGVLLVILVSIASPFIALYIWHGLLVLVPAHVYTRSGPIKRTFDPIRASLQRIVFGADEHERGAAHGISLILSGIGYMGVSIYLLVHCVKFLMDPRFDRVASYNEAVASWQEGLAAQYASDWTSRQNLTLYLEQTVDARDSPPLTYSPAFHLETNTTVQESLPQLETPGDLNKYEAKTMVAATIENFHVPTIRPSEGDGVLFVSIGDQNFTFATVRRYKIPGDYTGKSHCDRYLNGLVFVFDEDVRRQDCTPMYVNLHPTGGCYRQWSSLHPPQNLTLRVEIRSPNDPVIVARDLFGCSTDWDSAFRTESARDQLHRIAIVAYVLGCFGLVLFLLSTPDMWFADPIKFLNEKKSDIDIKFLNEKKSDIDDDDVEKSSRVEEESKPAEQFVDTGATGVGGGGMNKG